MSDAPEIDPTSTYVLGNDDIVEESETLELTGLIQQLTADLLSSEPELEDLEEEED